jgi:hypothetical protein
MRAVSLILLLLSQAGGRRILRDDCEHTFDAASRIAWSLGYIAQHEPKNPHRLVIFKEKKFLHGAQHGTLDFDQDQMNCHIVANGRIAVEVMKGLKPDTVQ